MWQSSPIVLGLLFLGACNVLVGESWGQAADFVTQLRCGMTLQEIEELTEEHGGAEIAPQEGPDWPNYLVVKKNTTISLFVGDAGLELASRSDVTGVQEVQVAPRRDLCTGEVTVELSIIAPEGFEGAEVYLNGSKVGEIPASRLTSIRVPLGQHEIKVEHPAGPSAVTRLDLDEESSGRQRWEIADRRQAGTRP